MIFLFLYEDEVFESKQLKRVFYIIMSRYIPRRTKGDTTTKKSLTNSSMISKGATDALKIDKGDIERTIEFLRQNHDVLINQANKELADEINRIRNYVRQFHGTSSYQDFYKLVIKHFSDVSEPMPRTVGAFCIGFHQAKGELKQKKYAATCIDSIPLPDEPLEQEYNHSVILLYRDGVHVFCKSLLTIKTENYAFVFLMGENDENKLDNALSTKEIEMIRQLGISSYHLYAYRGGVYYDASKGVVDISRSLQLNFRSDDSISHKKHERRDKIIGKGTNNTFIWIILLIVIVLIIIFSIAAVRRR